MRRINSLRGVRRYLAWAVIGLVVGFVLALVDHLIEPEQPLYILVVIGLLAGLTQALYSERASKRQS
jgi:cobalamin synthase